MKELSKYRMEQAKQCIKSAKADEVNEQIEHAIRFCDVVESYLVENGGIYGTDTDFF